MADSVQKILERSIPELEDLQERGLFNESEIRSITNKRRDYEYRLQRRGKTLEDFLRYIEYEKSLDKLRLLRKERLKLQKNTLSDFSCTKRVQFIFDRALQRFQRNVSLWLMCIDHAIATKSGKRVGRLFPKALRLHPLNVKLWIKAAEWECNGNQSFSSARILLSRGLRLNRGDPTLYRELFELELSYASVIKERRRILGLDNTTAEESVENESISETKLSIPQLPNEVVEDDANTNNKDLSQDDAKKKMIQGMLAVIVFNNAIQKIKSTKDCIQFGLDCLNISSTYYDDIPNVTNHVLSVFETNTKFNKSEDCWEARVKWHLRSNNDSDSSSGDDEEMGADNSSRKRARKNVYDVDATVKKDVILLYKTALKILPTVKMYDYYVKFILLYGTGKEILECFQLLELENTITLQQYGEWIRISSRFNNIEENNKMKRKSKRKKLAKAAANTKKSLNAIDIARKAVAKYSNEAVSWLYLIDVLLHNLQYDSTTNAFEHLEEAFQEAVNKVSQTSEKAINIDVKWVQLKDAMKVNMNDISKHVLHRLRNGNLEDKNKIKLSQVFIDLIVENKVEKNLLHIFVNDIISNNEKVNPIFLVCPWELYKMAIYAEITMNAVNANVTFIRKLFESAIVSDSNNEELWLDYIRFESEKPGDVRKVTKIAWRAKQNLTNKDEFEEKLIKMQSGFI